IDTCTIPQTPREKWLIEDADGPVVPLLRVKAAERDGETAKIANAERQQQLKEYQRQLYVAMTRAQERLYISGVQLRNGYKGSWHESLGPVFEGMTGIERRASEHGDILSLGREPGGEAAARERQAGTNPPAPSWLELPAPRENAPLRRTPSAL